MAFPILIEIYAHIAEKGVGPKRDFLLRVACSPKVLQIVENLKIYMHIHAGYAFGLDLQPALSLFMSLSAYLKFPKYTEKCMQNILEHFQ